MVTIGLVLLGLLMYALLVLLVAHVVGFNEKNKG